MLTVMVIKKQMK